jgi:uncharacterized membrane protein
MGIALMLHLMGVVIWVGGMFFAYMALRPVAATQLEPPPRLRLWAGVFGRFFPWVWASVAVILASGLWIIFAVFGGMAGAGLYVHIMLGLGLLMMGIYAHVFFAPYKRLKAAVSAENWPAGGKALGQIRLLVGINTLLGALTIAVAASGRYFLL